MISQYFLLAWVIRQINSINKRRYVGAKPTRIFGQNACLISLSQTQKHAQNATRYQHETLTKPRVLYIKLKSKKRGTQSQRSGAQKTPKTAVRAAQRLTDAVRLFLFFRPHQSTKRRRTTTKVFVVQRRSRSLKPNVIPTSHAPSRADRATGTWYIPIFLIFLIF